MVISVASAAASGVPYIGPLIGMAINGVLYGGLYAFYLKLIRGQKAELADAFDGFRFSFDQLLVASLIVNLLCGLGMAIAALPILFTLVPVMIQIATNPEAAPDILLTAIGVGTAVNLFFCILVALALYLVWIFAFTLILDKKMKFWPAMEASRKAVMNHPGPMIKLLLTGVLLAIGGVLACCIGIFFTMPIFFGAVAYAYEDLFGS